MIRTVLQAGKKYREVNGITYRTVSIASDGEAKRGDALVEITMRWFLRSTSPIYHQLKPLTFLNLLVGEDDITADKDFKHIFKRQRNLMLRNKGFVIKGFCITPSILRGQLQSNGVPSYRIRSLLNPNDKQDVVLGYALLKEIWSLPSVMTASNPVLQRARDALKLYGEFAQYLITPYICIDLNLDEQLTHLSTAAHMAFYFYSDNSAKTNFMPSQSYIDLMIMIKNAYFCVAKFKEDNPNGKFYIILLGTDRLEGFFGLIRTAVGTDCNVDLFQLGSRASGLTEVAVILALHPEWDRSPRRLTLKAMTKEMKEFTYKVDHINPASWRGDVHVKNVNLHACWLLGRQKAIELIPRAESVFNNAEANDDIDFLSPFGTILVNKRDDEDGSYDCSELLTEYPSESEDPIIIPTEPLQPPTTVSHSGTTLEGDLEDAIANECPRGPISSEVTINGKVMNKPAALRQKLQHLFNRSSTDRLRRVKEVPCFNSSDIEAPSEESIVHDSELGAPCLRVGHPAAALVSCEGRVFLALVNVLELKFGGDINLPELELQYLPDKTARIDFQILRVVPASEDIDHRDEYDWCWLQGMEAVCHDVPGRLVCTVNPGILIQKPGEMAYLFSSSSLLVLAAHLRRDLRPCDISHIPIVKRTPNFPYRLEGKACFLVERNEEEQSISSEGSICSKCGPRTSLDRSNAQRILEHMAAHILYDPAVRNPSQELCGLCLRPAPMCTIYLKKGRGASRGYSVNMKDSSCMNLIRFKYATAATSSENSPCSNVPVICPLCPQRAPAVWSYSLDAHFRDRHKLVPAYFPIKIQLSASETEGMKTIWDHKYQLRKKRNLKGKKNLPLDISASHSYGLHGRSVSHMLVGKILG